MTPPDKQLLGEAADWLIRLQAAPHDPALATDHDSWRQQSPAHEAAWQRALQLQSLLGHSRQPLARQLLQGRKPVSRRQIVQAMLLGAAPLTGWWLWRDDLRADYHTAVGEQRHYRLPDGTLLQLNTDSAVARADTPQQRELQLLRGEIAITTGRDSRPLHIHTPYGQLQPVGTRFAVRLDEAAANVTVSEGTVLLTQTNGSVHRIPAGQGRTFDGHQLQTPDRPPDEQLAWTDGQLRISNWPLSRLLAELSRYRRGVLRCSDDIANRRVSGLYWLHDTDAALALLAHSHDLRYYRLGPWLGWLTAR